MKTALARFAVSLLICAPALAGVVDVSAGGLTGSDDPDRRDRLDNLLYLEDTLSETIRFPSDFGTDIVGLGDDIHTILPMMMTGFSVTWFSQVSVGAGLQSMTVSFHENDTVNNVFGVPALASFTITGLGTGLNTTTAKVTTTQLPADVWMTVTFSNADMGLPLALDFQAEVGLGSTDLLLLLHDDGTVGASIGGYNPAGPFNNFLFGIYGQHIPEPSSLLLFAPMALVLLWRVRR